MTSTALPTATAQGETHAPLSLSGDDMTSATPPFTRSQNAIPELSQAHNTTPVSFTKPLLTLPTDILLTIFDYLDESSLASLLRVNRTFHSRLSPFLVAHAVKPRDDESALQWAAFRGHLSLARYLLSTGQGTNFPSATQQCPIPAFHLAIESASVPLVELFLSYGAAVNDTDKHQNTSIHTAVIALIHNSYNEFATGRDCCMGNNHEDVKQLNERGKRLAAILKVLLEQGPDLGRLNDNGDTPLHIAVSQSSFGGCRLAHKTLLSNGAPVNCRSRDGKTPLHVARGYDSFKLLVESGADLGALDEQGRTVLHVMARKGWVDAVKVLLVRGVRVNVRDKEGNTPLHLAVVKEMERRRTVNMNVDRVVGLLIKYGADLDAINGQGKKPLELALASGTTGSL